MQVPATSGGMLGPCGVGGMHAALRARGRAAHQAVERFTRILRLQVGRQLPVQRLLQPGDLRARELALTPAAAPARGRTAPLARNAGSRPAQFPGQARARPCACSLWKT